MNPNLHLVESFDDAARFLQWLQQPRSYLAVDSETTGLKWWTPGFLRTLQFGDVNDGWVIPTKWWFSLAKDAIEKYDRPIVMHNAKFDLHALESEGIQINERLVDDTRIMSWLVDPIGKHHLKGLATGLLDPSSAVGQGALKTAMHKNRWGWGDIPLDFMPYWAYGALDTCLTAGIVEILSRKLDELGLRSAYELELQVQLVMKQAETRGARIDLDYTRNLHFEWNTEMSQLEMDLKEFGIENPNANRQIEEALRRVEGWVPDDFTSTGQAKLDERVLRGLDYDIAKKIIRFKRLRKWTSTYLDTFINDNDDGVLHASINTLRARTGRMSITEPPLQTLPRGPEIRNCIIPSDNRFLVAVDYSQVELRMLAHLAQEQSMIEAFLRGEDLHSDTARRIFGEEFTSQQRSISKNANFATIYGAGPRKFAQTCNKDENVISESEAKDILDRYKSTYPGVTRFMRTVEEVAADRRANGGIPYVITKGGRRLPSEPDKLYALVNYLCQGTAAEVLKEAIVRIDNAGLSEYIVLPVHDEVIFDIPKENVTEITKELESLMSDYSLTVPLTVEASEPLERWGSKYALH